jgi:hypothetical protein
VESKPTKLSNPKAVPVGSGKLRTPKPGPQPNTNPELDSFESVMQAMDAELARQKRETKRPTSSSIGAGSDYLPEGYAGKSKVKSAVRFAKDIDEPSSEDDMDIEAAMDEELKAALNATSGDLAEDESDEELPSADYNLIKNFLESFKSQAGLPGPVGNLAGRLQDGWTIPRDQ